MKRVFRHASEELHPNLRIHGGLSEVFFGDGILIEPGEVARIVCRDFPPARQTAQREDFAKVGT